MLIAAIRNKFIVSFIAIFGTLSFHFLISVQVLSRIILSRLFSPPQTRVTFSFHAFSPPALLRRIFLSRFSLPTILCHIFFSALSTNFPAFSACPRVVVVIKTIPRLTVLC